ncbi:MAG: hypothetical protein MI919_22230, partial [Holophagales bacterium]|nr:hypothetical protein [Holophagales bacterium]
MRFDASSPRSLCLAGMLLLLAASLAPPGMADEPVHAFTGAQILPIAGDPIEDGVLVVRGRRIEAVGAAGAVSIPPAATVHDVAGKVIMPGLVDTHS